MIAHRDGVRVLACDGCHAIITEVPAGIDTRHHIEAMHSWTTSDDRRGHVCNVGCGVKFNTRVQDYRCPDCVITNKETCTHAQR